jgi:hypothetical protein
VSGLTANAVATHDVIVSGTLTLSVVLPDSLQSTLYGSNHIDMAYILNLVVYSYNLSLHLMKEKALQCGTQLAIFI